MNRLNALVVALVVSSPVKADFLDGNTLYKYMTEQSSYSNGVAAGYVIGVHDSNAGVEHCAPSNVTVKQTVDVVRAHLAAFPSLRHHYAETIVTYALQKAWPCKDKGNPT
jgi:hypothetical protein